jgi:methionyl-tRNA synthetase
MAGARDLNAFITIMQPWALKKTDPQKMCEVLRLLP